MIKTVKLLSYLYRFDNKLRVGNIMKTNLVLMNTLLMFKMNENFTNGKDINLETIEYLIQVLVQKKCENTIFCYL